MDKLITFDKKGGVHHHLLITTFLLASCLIFGQNYEAKYRVFVPKSKIKEVSSNEDINNTNKHFYLNQLKKSTPAIATLSMNDSVAIYTVDDIMVAEKQNDLMQVAAGKQSDFITKDAQLYYSLNLNKETYWVRHTNRNWSIKNEYRIISGYNCRLAVYKNKAGKSIKAWFAVDIGLPYGPFKYYGLPGLIIKVETPLACFELTKFNNKQNSIVKNYINYSSIVSEAEKKKLMKKYYPQIFNK